MIEQPMCPDCGIAITPQDPLCRRCRVRAIVESMRTKRAELVPPAPPPRYDDVYVAGMDWLDRQ